MSMDGFHLICPPHSQRWTVRATFISACSCSLISDSGSGPSDGEQRGRKVR